MDTEKMHSIKHAPNDVARWGDTVNTNTEAPESAHKNWVKGQGGKTNQGPAAQLSMMKHSLRKASSALCARPCKVLHALIEYFAYSAFLILLT